jgi:diadenosine tetraphosphate (Ap4A) HIT family hydrolase
MSAVQICQCEYVATISRVYFSPVACPLCSIDTDAPLVYYSDGDVTVALSDEWAVRGHSVVASRRHVESWSELDEAGAARFFAVLRRVERALLGTLPAERVVAVKLGLAVPHLHVHLYPISRQTTREEVFAILERRVRCELPPEERAALVAALGRVLRE